MQRKAKRLTGFFLADFVANQRASGR